jgi:hypothetical protein
MDHFQYVELVDEGAWKLLGIVPKGSEIKRSPKVTLKQETVQRSEETVQRSEGMNRRSPQQLQTIQLESAPSPKVRQEPVSKTAHSYDLRDLSIHPEQQYVLRDFMK